MGYKRLLTLLGIIVIGFLLSGKAYAQKNTNAGLIVHPSSFEFNASPGKTVSDTITLDNLQAKPVKIKVDLRNFTASGEEGSVNLTTNDTAYSLAKWIKVEPATVDINARESKTFTFTITVPENAEPGGHFGSVVFTTVPPAVKGTGAALSLEVASLISLETPGDAVEKAVVKSFTVDKSFYEFGPVTFVTRVGNEGKRHIAVNGSIVVKGMFGQKYIIPLYPPESILPGATKKIVSTLKNKLLVGPFTAQLIAGYGTKNSQLNAGVEFSAFPIRYGVIALAVLLLLVLARKRIAAIIKISVKILFTGKLPEK
jgi:hypothetical protein